MMSAEDTRETHRSFETCGSRISPVGRPIVARVSLLVGLAFIFVGCSAIFVGCSGGDDQAPRVDVSIGDAYALWQSETPPVFLDVRTQAEFERGHIEGAIHIPHTDVARRMDEIRALDQAEVIVFCERGGRARVAEGALAEAGGFEVKHMQGDMRGWRRMNLPTVSGGD